MLICCTVASTHFQGPHSDRQRHGKWLEMTVPCSVGEDRWSGPPTPRGSNPLPPIIFFPSPPPPPFFAYFFIMIFFYYDFFAPAHLTPAPRPFFTISTPNPAPLAFSAYRTPTVPILNWNILPIRPHTGTLPITQQHCRQLTVDEKCRSGVVRLCYYTMEIGPF